MNVSRRYYNFRNIMHHVDFPTVRSEKLVTILSYSGFFRLPSSCSICLSYFQCHHLTSANVHVPGYECPEVSTPGRRPWSKTIFVVGKRHWRAFNQEGFRSNRLRLGE